MPPLPLPPFFLKKEFFERRSPHNELPISLSNKLGPKKEFSFQCTVLHTWRSPWFLSPCFRREKWISQKQTLLFSGVILYLTFQRETVFDRRHRSLVPNFFWLFLPSFLVLWWDDPIVSVSADQTPPTLLFGREMFYRIWRILIFLIIVKWLFYCKGCNCKGCSFVFVLEDANMGKFQSRRRVHFHRVGGRRSS